MSRQRCTDRDIRLLLQLLQPLSTDTVITLQPLASDAVCAARYTQHLPCHCLCNCLAIAALDKEAIAPCIGAQHDAVAPFYFVAISVYACTAHLYTAKVHHGARNKPPALWTTSVLTLNSAMFWCCVWVGEAAQARESCNASREPCCCAGTKNRHNAAEAIQSCYRERFRWRLREASAKPSCVMKASGLVTSLRNCLSQLGSQMCSSQALPANWGYMDVGPQVVRNEPRGNEPRGLNERDLCFFEAVTQL